MWLIEVDNIPTFYGMSGWGRFVKRSVSVKNKVRQITAFNLCIFSGNHTRSIIMDLLGSNRKLLTSAAGGARAYPTRPLSWRFGVYDREASSFKISKYLKIDSKNRITFGGRIPNALGLKAFRQRIFFSLSESQFLLPCINTGGTSN